jgi:hypothetical protein
MAEKRPKQLFEHSAELKRLFNQHLESWSHRQRMNLDELAQRCGVSTQYLAHIGRYGRIPGKPILILLALNFGLADASSFLRAAQVKDPWPYEPGIGLRAKGAVESGFLSLNLDMAGFTSAIRDIVRSEIKPRTLEELLAGRALKVGLNRGQFFLFDAARQGRSEGFFPELMRLMALALHIEVEFIDIPHNGFTEALRSGTADLYGPVYYTTHRIGQALYTDPFCRVTVTGLGRVKTPAALAQLPLPKRLSDLRKKEYRIAVHADTMAHHFALTELGIPEDRLIPCELPEEALERVLMTDIPRPAHLLLTDAPYALKTHAQHKRETEVLFLDDSGRTAYEDTIALRSDWPAVVSVLNEMLEFMRRNGSLQRLYQRTIEAGSTSGVMVV